MIAFGASDMTKAYIGSTEVSKAYLGSDLVWGSSSPALPYDSEVTYVRSTGSQYIDLDYTCTANTIITVTMLLGEVTKQGRIIGCSSGYFESYINGSNRFAFASGGKTNASTVTASTTARRTITINNTTAKGTVGTSTVNLTKNTATYFGSMYLCSRPSASGTNVKCYIYSASITDGSLVRDLIPVRVGEVGYLYDKVSGRLFGDGDLLVGTDVTS